MHSDDLLERGLEDKTSTVGKLQARNLKLEALGKTGVSVYVWHVSLEVRKMWTRATVPDSITAQVNKMTSR